jgi:alkylation response protein AidB-like acyl-CoA dehydrogenase
VPFLFCGTIIGISESVLAASIEQIGARNSFGTPVAEFPTMQLHIAEAAAEIDCARMLMMRDTSEAMAAMREPRPLTMAEKARNRRDQAYAARLCTRAVDRLFSAAGAKGIFDDNVIQRKFRDLRAANVHIAVNWDLAGTTYGRVSLGLDPITPLI